MQQDALTRHARAGGTADYRERCRETLITALERTAMYASFAEPGKGRSAVRGTRGAPAAVFGPRVELHVAEVPALHPEKSGKFLLASRSFPLEDAHRA